MGKKNSITQIPYDLVSVPKTVRELIEQMVFLYIEDYSKNQDPLKNLSASEIEEQSFSGTISFGIRYGEKKIDLQQAVETAWQCFEDGIFRIFSGSDEWKTLNEPISLSEDSKLTFVRLTMLSGRIW